MKAVKPTTAKPSWVPAALAGAVLCGLLGCSAKQVPGPNVVGVSNPPATRAENIERLVKLHERRTSEHVDSDYVVGSGDVLTIKAFDFEQMNREVRVDGDGNINVPLLETVHVGGLTLSEVQQALTKRLGDYMYDPHVTVFVEEYRSQQVAVVGAVKQPGLVTLVNRDSSVLDAISAAGGMTGQAAGRIYLIPGELRSRQETAALADALQTGGADLRNANALGDAMPIMLDSREVPRGVESAFFNLPVRPGDVLMVPNAGEFQLEGWVQKPGTYPLRPGLTLRGALATGGGLRFAAKKSLIQIYRLGADGETEMESVNYQDILAHKTADVFIHEGDVIAVGPSSAKLVPYGFYKLMVDMVRVGAGLKVTP